MWKSFRRQRSCASSCPHGACSSSGEYHKGVCSLIGRDKLSEALFFCLQHVSINIQRVFFSPTFVRIPDKETWLKGPFGGVCAVNSSQGSLLETLDRRGSGTCPDPLWVLAYMSRVRPEDGACMEQLNACTRKTQRAHLSSPHKR